MKNDFDSLMTLYARLLRLYPRRFQAEFAEEMEVVFRDSLNEAFEKGTLPFIIVCIKELGGLPLSILREFWHELGRKETIMVTNEKMELTSTRSGKASYWEACLSTLPFTVFGIAMMVGKSHPPFHGGYTELGFFIIVLVGLIIGLAKGFPRWAYSYLGWSMVMSWNWTMMPMDTFQNYRTTLTHSQLLSWWGWVPFILALGISLLLARSFNPIRQMLLGVWRDWTLASFMIYTFVAFVTLIYDENHHPYLFLFMTVSTIIFSASVWFFMQSVDMRKQAISLLLGFVLAFATSYICDATWDWYNGFPRTIKLEFEYESLSSYVVFLVFYGLILLLPGVVGLIKSTINKGTTT